MIHNTSRLGNESGLYVPACPRTHRQCLSLPFSGCLLTFGGCIWGPLLSSSKASVCFFILSLLAGPLEKSGSEQIIGTEKQPQKQTLFLNNFEQFPCELKSQAYSEFQSLDWMVQKNLWSTLFGLEAHHCGWLVVGPYMSPTPRNDPSSIAEGAELKIPVLPAQSCLCC